MSEFDLADMLRKSAERSPEFDIEAYLKDLKKAVNIDSGAGCKDTEKVACFLREKFDSLGLRTEIRGESPILLVSNHAKNAKNDVLFLAHMDTVFSPGTAKERPFSINANGLVNGPGCSDCKGGCIALYYLIRTMLEAGELRFNFQIVINSDEERQSVSSKDTISAFAKKSSLCFVFEPGRPRQEFVTRRKGGSNYRVICRGISAHSGVEPEKGASAILEASRQIDDLYRKFFFPEKGIVINVGQIGGGRQSGEVPDYAEFSLSMRANTQKQIDRARKYIEAMPSRLFDGRCSIEIQTVMYRPLMSPNERTREVLKIMRSEGKKAGYPVLTISTGGGSDGNFAAEFCPVIDGCGPSGGNLHTKDEYLIPETVGQRINLMRETLKRLF